MHIAVYNDKGGCAKSTFTREMALFLERKRKTPLIVDLDYKHSITKSFEIEAEKSVSDVLEGIADIGDVLVSTEYIDVIPGSYNVRMCDINTNLRAELEGLKENYDYILYDTALEDEVSDMAIYCSDAVIVPVIPQKYDVDNLRYTVEHIKKVAENGQKIFALVMKCDKSEDVLSEMERIRKICKEENINLFVNAIRNDETVKSVQEKGKELRSYDFVSESAEDYKALADEFISRFEDYRKELLQREEIASEVSEETEEAVEVHLE